MHERWIDNKIEEGKIIEYKYEEFKKFKKIGIGAHSTVLRVVVNRENIETMYALKIIESNANISEDIVKEYADNGTLSDYLSKNATKIEWDLKIYFAIQLVDAVKWLHGSNVIHGDLHSNNILIHQETLKLADFGLSQRINVSTKSKTTSRIFGLAPYIAPECFVLNKEQDGKSRRSNITKKSDVYSVGVLLWEISSERPPFEHYDPATLPVLIIDGLREKPVDGIHNIYISIFEKCWQNKQDDRPSINEVSLLLNDILNPFYKDIPYSKPEDFDISDFKKRCQECVDTIFNEPSNISITPELHINEQDPKIIFINDLYLNFCKSFNKGISVPNIINNYISEKGKSDSDVLNWLYLKNEPNYVCLRGIFYMWDIGIKQSNVNVFDLFLDAANRRDIVAQYFVGRCHEVGRNTKKDMKKAIEWYNKAIEKDCAAAERILGDYYYKCQRYTKAFKLLKNATDKGNIMAMHNLGLCYQKGRGTDLDKDQGFKLLKQAAEKGVPNSPYELAKCYEYGEGTVEDLKQASYWYKKAIENNYNCHDAQERVMAKIMKKQSKSNVE
ncbi:5382_t:CDS:2 [Dentiscutata heterogama]|uniref:5382_t:CDS:1 n=1 Tax=Dentiscutata heterogama TaxID=1316150 RepID=A0ACA9JYZ3_9GLOM|nr:5382_t:CDS:2 [Dentiscutata heterogama]